MSFRDVEGIEHSVEVTAESLFEAAALGMHALKRSGFSSGPGSAAELAVTVRSPATTHKLPVSRLLAWLESNSVSPKEQVKKKRLLDLLRT